MDVEMRCPGLLLPPRGVVQVLFLGARGGSGRNGVSPEPRNSDLEARQRQPAAAQSTNKVRTRAVRVLRKPGTRQRLGAAEKQSPKTKLAKRTCHVSSSVSL